MKCFENEHTTRKLGGRIKQINLNNIKDIKYILNKNIIHIKEDDEIIKIIIQYINKYIITNKDSNNKDNDNSINEDLTLIKVFDNQDILLINRIISVDYINYIHYINIEDILGYLRNNYNIKYNNEYNGYGKMIYENGEYYIGEWKDGLRHGKGILFFNNAKLIFSGVFIGDTFEGTGNFEY